MSWAVTILGKYSKKNDISFQILPLWPLFEFQIVPYAMGMLMKRLMINSLDSRVVGLMACVTNCSGAEVQLETPALDVG